MQDRSAGRTALRKSEIDLSRLDTLLEDFKGQPGSVIPILQRAQDAYGYLPREVLTAISQKTRIPLSRLYGVATFYAQFRLTRRGRHLIRVCDGTACHVRGAAKSIGELEKHLQITPGTTSPDYRYTLEIVYCLGSCGIAPVALVDDKVLGRLAPDALVNQMQKLD
jgi:NADH:ubiquinone oxidoreductase subunit E